MSKLMFIFGILFMSAGLALGFLVHFSPGEMQVRGLTPDVAAILLVGGAVCLGLGGLIGALRDAPVAAVPVAAVTETTVVEEKPPTPKFTGFGKKTETAAAVVKTGEAVAETSTAVKSSVSDTISALEQAKTDIAVALGVETHEPSRPEPPATRPEMPQARPTIAKSEPEPKVEAEEVAELYVVEEKVIRGRPARVLSDGTVEAETDDGWMRFENLEHLDEYLEAMVPET
jgi:hypothetical protein